MPRTVLPMAALALFSCGDGKADVARQQASQDTLLVADTQVVREIDLGQYDIPLLLTLPAASAEGGEEPQMGWNEEEGWFGIKAGDHFSLQITEAPGDIPRLKRDLDRDLLRKHTLLTDRPELVIYRSEFPDDPSLVFMHHYQVIVADGRSFVVESDPEGRFNEADITRMVASIMTKAPA